jgi:hypothetical protein
MDALIMHDTGRDALIGRFVKQAGGWHCLSSELPVSKIRKPDRGICGGGVTFDMRSSRKNERLNVHFQSIKKIYLTAPRLEHF